MEERRDALPGDRGVDEVRKAVGELCESSRCENRSSQTYRQTLEIRPRRRESENSEREPDSRERLDPGVEAIHSLRHPSVGTERFFFLDVPSLRSLLRDASAMAHHFLDQVVAHLEPLVRPQAPLRQVAARQNAEREKNRRKENPFEDRPGSESDDAERDHDLNQGGEGKKTSRQGEGLDRFRLEDAREMPSGAVGAELVRIELHRALEETLLQELTRRNRECPRRPRRENTERKHRSEGERPGVEIPGVDRGLEDAPAEKPPGEDEEAVVHGIRKSEERRESGQSSATHRPAFPLRGGRAASSGRTRAARAPAPPRRDAGTASPPASGAPPGNRPRRAGPCPEPGSRSKPSLSLTSWVIARRVASFQCARARDRNARRVSRSSPRKGSSRRASRMPFRRSARAKRTLCPSPPETRAPPSPSLTSRGRVSGPSTVRASERSQASSFP